MDINETLVDARFKDARPLDTVEKIRSLLAEHGIETEEHWHETGVPFCYALCVSIRGTTFQVNGKGLTREFALASGYGELIERFQLGYIGTLEDQKTGGNAAMRSLPKRTVPELLDMAPGVYQALSDRLRQIMELELSAEALLGQFADPQGQIPCVPCHVLGTARQVAFPDRIRTRVYGSNGCAAGNTIEEAVVQGLSETVERHTQAQIGLQGWTPPDVPEEVLQRFPVAYDIIRYVRSQGYRVQIKDCSMGKKFPVICACFFHEATGRYHTHFGAYPIFEIALTRALTESFQGRHIDAVTDMSELSFDDQGLTPLECLTGDFFVGVSKKPASFFVGTPTAPFDPDMGFHADSNEALLRSCVDYFAELGHQILVYDRSVLGFPTCQVLIPGYSEVFVDRLSTGEDRYRYAPYAVRALRSPTTAQIPELLGLLMHLDQMEKLSRNDQLSRGFLNAACLSARLSRAEEQRLMSASLCYVYHKLGRLPEAIRSMDAVIAGCDGPEAAILTAFKRYLTMRRLGREEGYIRQVLETFHDRATVERLFADLAQGHTPLERQVLRCRLDCREDCLLYGKCCKARHNRLSALIDDCFKKHDPTPQFQRLEQILA